MNEEEQRAGRKRVQRRSAVVLTLMTFGVFAMMGRTFYIQVVAPHNFEGHDLVASAVEQRREKFELDSGRGDILDRNGTSLTGSIVNGIVVLPVWQQDLNLKKTERPRRSAPHQHHHVGEATKCETRPVLAVSARRTRQTTGSQIDR